LDCSWTPRNRAGARNPELANRLLGEAQRDAWLEAERAELTLRKLDPSDDTEGNGLPLLMDGGDPAGELALAQPHKACNVLSEPVMAVAEVAVARANLAMARRKPLEALPLAEQALDELLRWEAKLTEFGLLGVDRSGHSAAISKAAHAGLRKQLELQRPQAADDDEAEEKSSFVPTSTIPLSQYLDPDVSLPTDPWSWRLSCAVARAHLGVCAVLSALDRHAVALTHAQNAVRRLRAVLLRWKFGDVVLAKLRPVAPSHLTGKRRQARQRRRPRSSLASEPTGDRAGSVVSSTTMEQGDVITSASAAKAGSVVSVDRVEPGAGGVVDLRDARPPGSQQMVEQVVPVFAAGCFNAGAEFEHLHRAWPAKVLYATGLHALLRLAPGEAALIECCAKAVDSLHYVHSPPTGLDSAHGQATGEVPTDEAEDAALTGTVDTSRGYSLTAAVDVDKHLQRRRTTARSRREPQQSGDILRAEKMFEDALGERWPAQPLSAATQDRVELSGVTGGVTGPSRSEFRLAYDPPGFGPTGGAPSPREVARTDKLSASRRSARHSGLYRAKQRGAEPDDSASNDALASSRAQLEDDPDTVFGDEETALRQGAAPYGPGDGSLAGGAPLRFDANTVAGFTSSGAHAFEVGSRLRAHRLKAEQEHGKRVVGGGPGGPDLPEDLKKLPKTGGDSDEDSDSGFGKGRRGKLTEEQRMLEARMTYGVVDNDGILAFSGARAHQVRSRRAERRGETGGLYGTQFQRSVGPSAGTSSMPRTSEMLEPAQRSESYNHRPRTTSTGRARMRTTAIHPDESSVHPTATGLPTSALERARLEVLQLELEAREKRRLKVVRDPTGVSEDTIAFAQKHAPTLVPVLRHGAALSELRAKRGAGPPPLTEEAVDVYREGSWEPPRTHRDEVLERGRAVQAERATQRWEDPLQGGSAPARAVTTDRAVSGLTQSGTATPSMPIIWWRLTDGEKTGIIGDAKVHRRMGDAAAMGHQLVSEDCESDGEGRVVSREKLFVKAGSKTGYLLRTSVPVDITHVPTYHEDLARFRRETELAHRAVKAGLRVPEGTQDDVAEAARIAAGWNLLRAGATHHEGDRYGETLRSTHLDRARHFPKPPATHELNEVTRRIARDLSPRSNMAAVSDAQLSEATSVMTGSEDTNEVLAWKLSRRHRVHQRMIADAPGDAGLNEPMEERPRRLSVDATPPPQSILVQSSDAALGQLPLHLRPEEQGTAPLRNTVRDLRGVPRVGTATPGVRNPTAGLASLGRSVVSTPDLMSGMFVPRHAPIPAKRAGVKPRVTLSSPKTKFRSPPSPTASELAHTAYL
jgi:hypothetical protein